MTCKLFRIQLNLLKSEIHVRWFDLNFSSKCKHWRGEQATPFLYFCHFAVKLKLNPQRRERLLKQNRRGDKGQLLRVEPPAGPE